VLSILPVEIVVLVRDVVRSRSWVLAVYVQVYRCPTFICNRSLDLNGRSSDTVYEVDREGVAALGAKYFNWRQN
jgi:hypothetical protein